MDIITVIKDLEAHGTGTHADGKVNTLDGGTILETVHAVKEREMPGTGVAMSEQEGGVSLQLLRSRKSV